MNTIELASFEKAVEPPPVGSKHFSLDQWESIRDGGIAPLNVSGYGGMSEDRQEWIDGARLLRLLGPRALPSAKLPPQMLKLHDVLAAGHGLNAVLQPRRTSKSTGLIAEGLGRAQHRDDYRVAIFTATTAKAGRSRFLKDVVPHLKRLQAVGDPAVPAFKIREGAGMESVTFEASGGFVAWTGTLDDLRGEAFDLIIIDESQDPEPEKGKDIVAAALPTLDTRLGAQIVYVGTAGLYRKGNLLWGGLETGRHGAGGILEYAAPPHTSDEELASWEPTEEHPAGHVRELVLGAHPGIGSLTTLQVVKDRYEALDRETFAIEYLSLFGNAGSGFGVVNMERWAEGALTGDLPQPPERFSLAMSVHPDQRSAAIVAVWREDGIAHLLVLDHRRGVTWVADEALRLSRKYSTPIVHDVQGAVSVEVEHLNRQRPRPRLAPQTFPNVKTAAALIIKEIEAGHVRHYDQDDMNEAARLVVKRPVGPTAWALGRGDAEDDIVCLEAAAMGLRAYDDGGKRKAILPPS